MTPELLLAYVGPGVGLGIIGAIVAALTTAVLAFFGLLWYPVKRLLGLSRDAEETATGREEAAKPTRGTEG